MSFSPETVVREFFEQIRSGHYLEKAPRLMAPKVAAHQIASEYPMSIERTPEEYADHVREMQAAFGDFQLEINEFIAAGDRVFVRWTQTGNHIGFYERFAPTGLPVVEFASAVYRVEDGKIAEYWIQVDREGTRMQLERNKEKAEAME